MAFLLFLRLLASFDYNGVIGTGQSLSVGSGEEANSDFLRTQAFNNLKIALNDKEGQWPLDPADPQLSLVPLTEPLRPIATGYPSCYPNNVFGETPHTAMSHQISSLANGIVTIQTAAGESGQGIDKLNKNAIDDGSTGRAYKGSLFEIEAHYNLATAAGKSYGVQMITLTHGETDSGNTNYLNDVLTLYSDYCQDIKAITRQTTDPILLVNQQHSYGWGGLPISTLAQWQLGQGHPGIYLMGPKYQYPYFSDNIHLTSKGYNLLGEKMGEIYNEIIVKGNTGWRPLEPIEASRSGNNVISVSFNVPVPPLVWDDILPPPAANQAWAQGKGFEVSANDAAVEISGVEINGDRVEITIVGGLPAGEVKVGYAATQGTPQSGGTMRWGLLKDSDDLKGYITGEIQPNWCISFEMTI